MRNIYLHIGCGKTGSSALQVWLNQNSEKFESLGIHYPRFEGEIRNAYQITSGNGFKAVQEIQAGGARHFFYDLAREYQGNVLLSSENFQLLDRDRLSEINSIFAELGYCPIVIVYLRDLLDILNSTYHQFVKRHLLKDSFHDFVFRQNSIQQFVVIDSWAACFGNMVVLHYDSEKQHLDRSFLRTLGIAPNLVPGMKSNIVNRSLTLFELELLRFMNELCLEKFGSCDERFSMMISDTLIQSSPEEKTVIFYDKEIEDRLSDTFGGKITEINNRYFSGEPRLAVFRPEGKNLASQKAKIDTRYKEAMMALMGMVDSINVFGNKITPRPVNDIPLDIHDPRIVDVLRNEAIKSEAVDLDVSLTLMKAAQVLRPTGPVINQKIGEYKERLGLV